MNKRLMISFILFILAISFAVAMPPHPDVEKMIQEGKIQDENYFKAGTVDEPNDMDIKGYIRKKRAEGIKSGTAVPFKVLVLLVDFNDKPAQISPSFFDELIFDDAKPSMKHYYLENSYGNFEFTTLNLPSTTGWQRALENYAYYITNADGICTNGYSTNYPRNSQKITEDLVDRVDPFIDFSQYDNNGDGYVDGIIIVHAGAGMERAGGCNIWSHTWGISNRLKDGVYINRYSIQPEYWLSPGDITIGVYAHETGHLIFGLPDMYNTAYGSGMVGKWSLMSTGSWNGGGVGGGSPAHLDAWSKIKQGWVVPSTITNSGTLVNLQSVESNSLIYKIWKDNVFGNEYFLVENRQKILYDSALPGAGLLIWHIDEAKKGSNERWKPGWDPTKHAHIALEQADGLWQLEDFGGGDSGDPWPGGTNKRGFNDISIPNSFSYLNGNSYVGVNEISNSDMIMTARLLFNENPPNTIPPSVSITNPVVDQTFTGNINLNVVANDDIGISKVEFYFDGNKIGESVSSPYNFIWNSKSTSLGAHTLYVKAIDTSGNSATSSTLNLNTIYCGDMDKNGIYDIFDVSHLINYAFRNGPAPVPLALGDTNGDGIASNVLDVNTLIDYAFRNTNNLASCNKITSQTAPPQNQGTGSLTTTKPKTTTPGTATKTTATNKKTSTKTQTMTKPGAKTRTISAKVIDEISDFDNGIGYIVVVVLIILGITLIKSVKKDKSIKAKKKK